MMTSDSKQQAIRELAYTKWEQAGKPPGDGSDFWLEAERDLTEQDEREASFSDDGAPPIKIAKATGNSRKKAG